MCYKKFNRSCLIVSFILFTYIFNIRCCAFVIVPSWIVPSWIVPSWIVPRWWVACSEGRAIERGEGVGVMICFKKCSLREVITRVRFCFLNHFGIIARSDTLAVPARSDTLACACSLKYPRLCLLAQIPSLVPARSNTLAVIGALFSVIASKSLL
jgi:hypothetical protein